MPEVRGSTYRKSTRPPLPICPPTCAPSPCTTRVIRTGPSYIRQSWVPSFYNPYYSPAVISPPPLVVRRSPTVIVDESSVMIVRDKKAWKRDAVITGVVLAAIVVICVATAAVSISRDCHWIRTDCTPPDVWSNQWCNDVYDCKW
jgi:hypothetical protein